MAVIREDSVSPYVIGNGSVIRPIPSSYRIGTMVCGESGPVLFNNEWRYVTGTTEHEVGDKFPVKMIGHSPYFNVGGEVWTTHGSSHYFTEGKRVAFDTNTRHYHGQEYTPAYNDPEWKDPR